MPDGGEDRSGPHFGPDAGTTALRLRDGAELCVRAIRTSDREALAAGFAAMSDDSRYQRFLTPIHELSDRQLDYLTDLDHDSHEALIAFDPQTGRFAGVARFVRLADPTAAEAAVTVHDDWQGRGVGTALCNMLSDRAREVGVERFTAVLLASNRGMLDVLSSLGPAHVISQEGSTIEVEVDLPENGIGDHMRGVLRVMAGGAVELATPPWGLRAQPRRR
ncbi:GNAT family N-acetyltransferase [Thermoleophilia bacterium SCSIO 60948]|nr:GNAT family N-acetyltransferase [Thermoleophilia bacterium SCSIO 60948]